MPGLDPAAFGRLDAYQFLLTGQAGGGAAPNVRRLEAAELAAAGLDYPDLVGAADVVVTKPGYGIVTDCIGARTRARLHGPRRLPGVPDPGRAEMPQLPLPHVRTSPRTRTSVDGPPRTSALRRAFIGARRAGAPPDNRAQPSRPDRIARRSRSQAAEPEAATSRPLSA